MKDWADQDQAEYRQCEAEAADIQSQIQDREHAYERGDITWAEYQSWEFDYGPLDVGAEHDLSESVETLDTPPF